MLADGWQAVKRPSIFQDPPRRLIRYRSLTAVLELKTLGCVRVTDVSGDAVTGGLGYYRKECC